MAFSCVTWPHPSSPVWFNCGGKKLGSIALYICIQMIHRIIKTFSDFFRFLWFFFIFIFFTADNARGAVSILRLGRLWVRAPACHSAFCHTNRLGVPSLQLFWPFKGPTLFKFQLFRSGDCSLPAPPTRVAARATCLLLLLFLSLFLSRGSARTLTLSAGSWEANALLQKTVTQVLHIWEGCQKLKMKCKDVNTAAIIWSNKSVATLQPAFYELCWWNTFLCCSSGSPLICPNLILSAKVLEANLYTVQIMKWKHAITKITCIN